MKLNSTKNLFAGLFFFSLTVMALFISTVVVNAQTSSSGIRITEYMYGGANGEFVEMTNTGTVAIDMTGWSFDDNTRTPGSQSLTAFGIVQPGESVVLTENNAGTFRTAWALCPGIKIIGGLVNNLGRDDEINIYDAGNNLVDQLTYGDDVFAAGTIRANNISGFVNAAGLGANAIAQWKLSAVGDAEGSYKSSGNDIGSPGKSTRATVLFNPCVVANGAPTIKIDPVTTSDYLDGATTTSPLSPFGVAASINDPTDPAKVLGINFIIGDDVTPVANLTVTALSGNTAVVPAANIALTGTGSSRNLKIIPAAVGYSNISLSVNDGTATTVYVITYAASAASQSPADTRWHTGISDASDAIGLDDDYFITGDDEQNVLNVYSRNNSGLPVKSVNYTASLSLPDPAKPEVDVEAATRSISSPARIYWLGSMSNGKEPFDNKPNRNRLFATDVTGTGTTTSITFAGYIDNLRAALLAWGDAHGYNFSASAAAGVDSKTPGGFAAEGMVFGPDNTTLYIGLRAPLVPVASRTNAVVAPILNFETWFNNGSPAGNPVFAQPIELNLAGRGIRDLIKLANGTYIILAGDPGPAINSALYKWSGMAADQPVLINSSANGLLNMEGVMPLTEAGSLSLSKLQLISDGGDDNLYNDGSAAKDLGDNNIKKFRSDVLSNLLLCQSSKGDSTAIVCNSFTWYDSTYTQTPAAPPTHVLVNAAGCDSIVTLHLTVNYCNLPPAITIISPANNAVYPAGTLASLKAVATDTDGSIKKVQFYSNGLAFLTDSVAPYEFSGNEIEPGNYLVTAKAFDNAGDSSSSDTVRVTISGCSGSGSLSAYGYLNIPGTTLLNLSSDPDYPSNPDISTTVPNFEYGPNFADNYGGKLRGYICAPATGYYTFYLASDDQSELWLSNDDNPSNIQRIARVESRVNFRSWYTAPSQRSVAIRLVKGVRYYVETVHKEGTGNDHLSVGWILPGGVFEGPIRGSRLSPFQTITGNGNRTFEQQMRVANQAVENITGLRVTATPNPTQNHFTIQTKSNSDAPVNIVIVDALGRIVERRTRLSANGTVQLGDKLGTGLYYLEITQGINRQGLKLIKK